MHGSLRRICEVDLKKWMLEVGDMIRLELLKSLDLADEDEDLEEQQLGKASGRKGKAQSRQGREGEEK